MSNDKDIAERHARILGRLSELGLELAERIALDALTAETPQARADFSRAFHTVSRSVRQSVALEAKLVADRKREGERALREAAILQAETVQAGAAEPEDLSRFRDPARIARRRDEARTAVQRVIWSEAEDEERDYLFDLLDQRLAIYGRSPTYGMDPLDAHIAFLCAQFGLPPEAARAWRDLPDPVFEGEAEGEGARPPTLPLSEYDLPAATIDWRSSA